MQPKNIAKFEKMNPDIMIHVMHLDMTDTIVPLYRSQYRRRKHCIQLLLLTDEIRVDKVTGRETEAMEGSKLVLKSHYTLVQSASRLFSSNSKHNGKVFVCPNCLHRFTREVLLERHSPDCFRNAPCRIRFPSTRVVSKKSEELMGDEAENYSDPESLEQLLGIDDDVRDILRGKQDAAVDDEIKTIVEEQMMDDCDNDNGNKLPEYIMHFKQVKNCYKNSFMFVVDFESFIVKDPNGGDDIHEPSGFACLRVSAFDFLNTEEIYVYSGNDVMEHFFSYLRKEHDLVNNILEHQMPMKHLTPDEQQDFDDATECKTCKKEFTSSNQKVRHHCHVTGNYIAAACNNCNLQLKPSKKFVKKRGKKGKWKWENKARSDYERNSRIIDKYVCEKQKDDYYIPVICHNMRGYDGHLIIKNMKKDFASEKISIIANNKEKFLAFQIGRIRFLDSLQFLNASLDALVNNLMKDGAHKFIHTRRHFADNEQFRRVTRKGCYPYEYVIGRERFAETRLPPIEAFYSKLYESNVSAEDYERAQDIWRVFGIENLQQYHDLYLMTDVLLLADVFENFREVSMKTYDLDATHYFTSPGLTLSACLKMTDIHLELFTHPDQLNLILRGIRGGVSQISNRYSRANVPGTPDYDPTLPNKYILYLDANNLYGHAMSQPLPTGRFKFLSEEEILQFDLNSIGVDDETGYILDVDLRYPPELHESHSDLPLAPESLLVTPEMLSPHCKELLEKIGQKPTAITRKLIPNLKDKFNYVIHYRNLQFYVKQGMIISKIHKIMSFRQSRWLAEYVQLNTRLRQQATSQFEKDFFKLMNNSLYGKTCENVLKRLNIKLTANQIQAERYIAQPSYQDFRIINEDISMVKLRQTALTWDKPSYIGFSVLDLSKLHMYEFHYDHMKAKYGSAAKLLFTDTDSLCYELTTPDAYKDMRDHAHLFDTSEFPITHLNHSMTNSKVPGMMKDECSGIPPIEYVGLRSKMYSIKMPGDKSKSTAKRIKTSFAKRHLKHETYKKCLFEETTTTASYYQITSDNHTLRTKKIDKRCLSGVDTKRFLLANTFDTLSYGDHRIASMCANPPRAHDILGS